MSEADPAGAARHLRAILDAIDSGEMEASSTLRARIEGGAVALETMFETVADDTSPSRSG